MDTMPSSEFRKRYASLTQPTGVTVNGHLIGVWHPGELKAFNEMLRSSSPGSEVAIPAVLDPTVTRFNTRPFTPVPKGSKR